MTSIARTTAWIAGLVAVLAGLLATGDRLPPPPWPAPDPGATWAWLVRTDPSFATFALLRIAAIVVVAYLLASTLVILAARATRLPALIRASSRLTLPAARRLIHHMAGAGFAITLVGATPVLAGAQTRSAPVVLLLPATAATPGTLAGPDPVGTASPPVLRALPDDSGDGDRAPTKDAPAPDPDAVPRSAPPVLVHLGPATAAGEGGPPTGSPVPASDGDAADPATAPPSAPDDPARTTDPGPVSGDPNGAPTGAAPRPGSAPAPGPMISLPASQPAAQDAPTADTPPTAAPSATTAGPSDPAVAPTTPPSTAAGAAATLDARHHVIETGDHLWGVAEETLAVAWDRPPHGDEIAGYLHDLIEVNRSVLAVPDLPDLVFPGQVFTLPPVPT